MDNTNAQIRPLSELVIPVEASFDDFVAKHGGELVRNLIQDVNPAKNADYVFRSPLVMAELKCVDRPAFTAKDSQKLNQLASKWMNLGHIPRFFETRQIQLRNLPAPCQRDLLNVLKAPWKKKLAAANKQVNMSGTNCDQGVACFTQWVRTYCG